MEIVVSPNEELPGQEVTEPQVISPEEISVPGIVQCPADVNIHPVSEDDGRDGREADPERGVAPLEPTQADAGDCQVRQDSIDSTERGSGIGSGRNSHRRLESDVSSIDLVPANESTLRRARGQPGSLPLKVTLQLAFQAIGVVFGDLGASSLFVYYSTLGGAGALPSEDNVLGALSLIIYTVTLVPLIKYILIVLKANDNGNDP